MLHAYHCLFLFLNVSVHFQCIWKRERNWSSICQLRLCRPATMGHGQAEATSQELHPFLPHEWQEPKWWLKSHHLLPAVCTWRGSWIWSGGARTETTNPAMQCRHPQQQLRCCTRYSFASYGSTHRKPGLLFFTHCFCLCVTVWVLKKYKSDLHLCFLWIRS